MIQLENLSKRFHHHTVIENLSYTFPDKGIFALMGPSGLGKTTLFRLLAGLEKPSSGQIQSTYQRVAVSFQEPRLIPWLTVLENILFVLKSGEDEITYAEQLLEKLELSHVKNALPDTLSGGMKQRVSLARALALRADLLLLDEPFSALDQELKVRIAPLIRAANPSALILLVTHDPGDAALLGAKLLTCIGSPFSALVEQGNA